MWNNFYLIYFSCLSMYLFFAIFRKYLIFHSGNMTFFSIQRWCVKTVQKHINKVWRLTGMKDHYFQQDAPPPCTQRCYLIKLFRDKHKQGEVFKPGVWTPFKTLHNWTTDIKENNKHCFLGIYQSFGNW